MTHVEAMHKAEHEYFLALMTEHNWNYTSAARAAGVNRTHIYRMLQRAGLARPPAEKVTPRTMATTRLLQQLAVHR